MTAAPTDVLSHWQFDVVASDGDAVQVRPLGPDDRDGYDALVAGLRTAAAGDDGAAAPAVHRLPALDELVVDPPHRLSLAAHRDGELVAVASFERAAPQGGEAEVVVLAADLAGRAALPTLMVQYLAAGGREYGIERLVARVPVADEGQLAVLRDAGYRTEATSADGWVRLELVLGGPPGAGREASEGERGRTAEVRAVDRILRPKAVAVVGASSQHGTLGHRLFVNLLAGGFDGPVFPVNDQAAHVASVPAYATVLDVPGEIDLAVVAVPAAAVPGVVEQCGEKGVKALVVVSGGFGDGGPEGEALGQEAVVAARRAGIRLLGPGSLGVANLVVGLDASVAPRLPAIGRVALVGQAGVLTLAALARCEDHGIGISSWAALGDRFDVSGNDLLEYWEDDPDTDLVLMYVEGVGNPRRFARIARRVATRTPIVAVVPPRTGRAAWDDPDGLHRQCGVVPVDTVDELVDAALLLVAQPLPGGSGVAVLADVGAAGLLASHLTRGRGLHVAPIGSALAGRLSASTGRLVGPTAAIGLGSGAPAGRWEAAASALVDDAGVDSVVVVLGASSAEDASDAVAEVRRATDGTGTTLVGIALADGVEEAFVATDDHVRLPTYTSPESAGAALGRAVAHASWRAAPRRDGVALEGLDRAAARAVLDEVVEGHGAGTEVVLDESTSIRLLAAYGIEVARASGPELGGPSGATAGGQALSVAIEEHPVVGVVVILARGGVATALAADRTVQVAPLGPADAAAMVDGLRCAPVVRAEAGVAGRAGLEDLLLRVGALADEHPEVVALDLGTVLVTGHGVVAAGPAVSVRVDPAPEEASRS